MAIITGNICYDLTGVVFAFIAIFVVYCQWAFRYWKVRGVPFVEPRIPWGSLKSQINSTISMGEEFAQMYANAKRDGHKHIGLYAATSPIYMPVDNDLIKRVLAKDFNYFNARGIYINEKDEPIGAHLFALGGKKWKSLRSKFTPNFSSGKLKSMFHTVISCGKMLENCLRTKINAEEPVDLKQFMGSFTISVIGSCAFGIDCNSFEDDNPFKQMANRIVNRTLSDDVKFAVAINFPKLASAIRLTWIPKTIKEFFTKVVVDTVTYRENSKIDRNDFLQGLINIKNDPETRGKLNEETAITMDEIVAQSFVFFVAGYETSATTMSWVLYEMAANPDIQERVREEIEEVLNNHNGEITYESLYDLKYMGQCIDETLRKYPPIPFLTRECSQDYQIPETNIVVEKGTRVVIPTIGIHYDEEYYDNPDVFDPERFSEENRKNIIPYTYVPFGEGPRLCLGMRFGIIQVKIGIMTVLRNYRISISKKMQIPLKLTPAFIPTPEGGLWLDMEKVC